MRPRQSALLALLLLVPAPSIGVAFAMAITPGTTGQVIYGVCKVWLLLFPLVWLLTVDRGRPSWSPMRQGGWGAGVITGLAICVVIIAAHWFLGRRLIDPTTVRAAAEQNGLTSAARYLSLVLYLTFVNSLLEEYVWRWFVFRKCEVLLGGWRAVLLSGVLFTVHHVIALRFQMGWDVTLLASLGVFLGGVIWSWCYLRYRSIWPGYVSHLLADAAIFWIGWQLLFA
jgi:membrane protease YdiL (CAAX protease family)